MYTHLRKYPPFLFVSQNLRVNLFFLFIFYWSITMYKSQFTTLDDALSLEHCFWIGKDLLFAEWLWCFAAMSTTGLQFVFLFLFFFCPNSSCLTHWKRFRKAVIRNICAELSNGSKWPDEMTYDSHWYHSQWWLNAHTHTRAHVGAWEGI